MWWCKERLGRSGLGLWTLKTSDGGTRRGCHRSESEQALSFSFCSIDRMQIGSAGGARCLFFCRVHNCQLLIQQSTAVLIITLKRKLRKWQKCILAVREVIILLSTSIYIFFFFFHPLWVSVSPQKQCESSPAGPRWGVISASGLRFHWAFT